MDSPKQVDEARVRGLITRVTGHDASRVALDEDLAGEVGLDSLDALNVLGALEEAFAVRFDDQQLELPRTLRGVLAKVARASKEDQCASA